MTSSQQEIALASFKYIDAHDYAALASNLSDDFTYEILPASLGGLGTPVRDKKQFLEFLEEIGHVVALFNLQTPKEVILGKDVVVCHTTSDGNTVSGLPFKNEYIFIFRFKGEKILSVKEFMDSKYVVEISAAEKAAMEKRATEAS